MTAEVEKEETVCEGFLFFSTEKVSGVFISFLPERIRNTSSRAGPGAALEDNLWGGSEALLGDISAQFRKAFPGSSSFLTVSRGAVQKPRLLVSH